MTKSERPNPLSFSRASRPLFSSLAVTTTVTPCDASCLQISNPIPLFDPVTTAYLHHKEIQMNEGSSISIINKGKIQSVVNYLVFASAMDEMRAQAVHNVVTMTLFYSVGSEVIFLFINYGECDYCYFCVWNQFAAFLFFFQPNSLTSFRIFASQHFILLKYKQYDALKVSDVCV